MNSYSQWEKENDYNGFLESLQSIINKKYLAKYRYGKLINEARTTAEADIIRNIIVDELKHYEQMTAMYHSLTGREPNPDISREWLEEDNQVIYASFIAEQKNVPLYLNLSERAPTPLFKKQFERAAADEQNHAVWFLSILTMK